LKKTALTQNGRKKLLVWLGFLVFFIRIDEFFDDLIVTLPAFSQGV